MSEFSLVISAMGMGFGHIQEAAVTNLIWVFSILAVASTYFILYSHQIQKAASRLLMKIGLKDLSGIDSEQKEAKVNPILVLGFFRNASAMLAEAVRQRPSLLDMIKVVDFNPLVIRRLKEMGVACVYGDIANMDTLHHADIHHAKIVLSTIPDYILRGTSNLKLLWAMQKLCPSAKVILTAEGPDQARQFYEAGAHYVVQPAALTGANLVKLIDEASGESLDVLREDAVKELQTRSEVLS
jgi:voltage-gated potassium channel Kch